MNQEELINRIESLEREIQLLKAGSTLPFENEQAIRDRLRLGTFVLTSALPAGLYTAPLALITSPTGGATIDSQARTAIDTIITRLETLGLVAAN